MNFSGRKVAALTVGIIGFLWGLGIFLLGGMQRGAAACGGTLLFGLLAAVAAVIYLGMIHCIPDGQAEEAGALPTIVTAVYVIAALSVNTVMMVMGRGGMSLALLLINLVMGTCYGTVIFYAERDARQIAERLERTEEKTAVPGLLSGKLGALLGMTQDGEIRSRLLRLKEAVDYGSNITTANTAQQEQRMLELLEELAQQIAAGEPEDAVLPKLREIEQCWSMRSSAASCTR